MVNQAIAYIFALSIVLILVVYYVGVKSDTSAFSTAFQQLLYTATGRDSSGKFAAYPTGG